MKIMKEYRIPVRDKKEQELVHKILDSMHVFSWSEIFVPDEGPWVRHVACKCDPIRWMRFEKKYGKVLFQERMES